MEVLEMLKLRPFKESNVLAGDNGLKNRVLNATLFDAPDGHTGCRQGDFIISTGYPITNNQDWEIGLMTLLEILVDRNCAGLGLKLGRYIPNLPAKAISYANENKLPIISLSHNLTWSDFIVPVITHINNQNNYELAMTYTTYELFHQHLKMREDLKELAKLLHKIVKFPVTIYIRNLDRRIDVPSNNVKDEEIRQIIGSCSVNIDIIQQIDEEDRSLTVRWIYSSSNIVGGIFLWGTHSQLQTWEQVALEQTAVITELEIERERAISATFQRFRNDFLTKLLHSVTESRETLYRLAQEVNWNLADYYRVALLDYYTYEEDNKDEKAAIWQHKNTILELMEKEAERLLPGSLIGLDNKNRIVILIPEEIDSTIIVKLLRKIVSHLGMNPFYGGMGRLYAIDHLSKSYEEASLSINAAAIESKNSNDILCIRSYSEMDVERILFSENPIYEAKRLVKDYLQMIIQFDQETNGELLATLRAFLNHNASFSETAKNLFIHKNTVRYRINMIHELSNLDPKNIKGQLLFQMALSTYDTCSLSES